MGLRKLKRKFFNFNFFLGGGGNLVTKTSLLFWNLHKIFDFDILYYLFQEENKIYLSEGLFFKFYDKKPKRVERPQTIEKCFS